jgi:tRNA(Ile)-lysidine synthase
VVERRDLRILRPLLAVPGAALRRRLARSGERWIEDPSNADPRFARVRLRRAGAPPAGEPGAGVARATRERRLAGFLALHAAVHEEGWIALDAAPLLALPAGLAAAALGRALAAVGGRDHPPRARELAGLVRALAGDARRYTLGGCSLDRSDSRIVVAREAASVAAPAAVDRDGAAFWDGRFEIRGATAANSVGALGACRSSARGAARRRAALPRAAFDALPALHDLDGSPTVPHLFCGRLGNGLDSVGAVIVAFRPPRPLAGAPFAPAGEERGAEAPGGDGRMIEVGAQPLAKPDAA